MKKNDVIDLRIEDLGIHGEGIGHAKGMAFFVPGAIPGDEVRAGVTKVKKSYAYARILSILAPSPDRIDPPCKAARKCGGCQIQEMSYPAQLRWKSRHVRDLLVRVGGFAPEKVDAVMRPIIGMETPFRYRNKAQYPVGTGREGEILTGFYAPHSHRIIPTGDCLIGAEENGPILKAVTSWMGKNHIRPYDETTGKGLIRHVLIRQGVHTGQTMVCLVASSGHLPDTEGLVRDLTEAAPDITSIVLNMNRARGNAILGPKTHLIAGEERITDTIGDITFQISARSFFQVNPVQMEKLYRKALEYADLKGTENVYDLYCGIGTISLFLARQCGHVTGIEIVADAIRDAKENARLNGISNADFFCGPTEDLLPRLVREGRGAVGALPAGTIAPAGGRPADVIVLDPPRKGCEPEVLDSILMAAPQRIVYVSCDPATLSRDLARLTGEGTYDLGAVTPVDQFGNSVHIEVVCLLKRREG